MKENMSSRSDRSASSLIPHPSSFARWRSAILGTLLVIGGLSAAAVTLLARQNDNYSLAAIAAILSLVSAALMLVFVVPPLARSARLEVRRFDLPLEVTSGGATIPEDRRPRSDTPSFPFATPAAIPSFYAMEKS